MLPLALVTGFLGSGKTTFLRHLSAAHAGRRLAFVVNDFAAVDIDAQALADFDGELVSLPGGSIFCRCLATTFIGALRRLAALTPPVEGVVIEASGMADPRAVADLLRETRLDALFALTHVIALVDPATFHKLLATLPAVRSQLEAADVVLLNKADLHDDATLALTEAAVRRVRADVPIMRCVRSSAEVLLFQGQSLALRVHGELAPCRDASFLAASVRFDPARPVDADKVRDVLDRYAEFLWRAKGFVPTDRGVVEMQWTMGAPASFTASTAPRAQSTLALVARGDAGAALDRLVAELGALAGKQQLSVLGDP